MRPLAGHVVGVIEGIVRIKLETGNYKTVRTEQVFKYGDKVRVNFNFKNGKIVSIKHWNEPAEGTQKCQRCIETHIEYGEDNIEDIW